MRHGGASIATEPRGPRWAARSGGYNRGPMISSLVRAFRGPSRDPRMAYISRPLPRDLHDEQVVEALAIALSANPDPEYLVETLPAALTSVTGHDYEVLDRSTRDVTGSFVKSMVMIRDGEVGLWPGYKARAYPLLAQSKHSEEARAAIADAEGSAPPSRKAGWEPPPPVVREPQPPRPVGDVETGAISTMDTD